MPGINDREQSSIANRVGLTLAAVTIIVTAINGIPPFLALRGKEPYVAYEIERVKMLYPDDANQTTIRELLRSQKIPDAFSSVSLSNRGDVSAREVIITASVPGVIVADKTDPSMEAKPPWVKIYNKEFDAEKDSSRIRYTLNELGLSRTFTIKVSYISEKRGDAAWEIFFDGKPAVLVNTLTSVPENARAISFVSTLKILGFGILLSVTAYLILRLRESVVLEVLRNILQGTPASSQRGGTLKRWRTFKNNVLLALANKPEVDLEWVTDGDINATEPKKFWDAIVSVSTCKIGLDIHISAQIWNGFTGDEDDQNMYCMKVLTMARTAEYPISIVAVVNDEDIWSQPRPSRIVNVLKELEKHSKVLEFIFASGSPEEIANKIITVVAENASKAKQGDKHC